MTHKATRVIMGVTTQPQTGGAICVITLILEPVHIKIASKIIAKVRFFKFNNLISS